MDPWNDATLSVPARFDAAQTGYRDELIARGFTHDAATEAAATFRSGFRFEADGHLRFVNPNSGQLEHPTQTLQDLALRRFYSAGACELVQPGAPPEPTPEETAAAIARGRRAAQRVISGMF